MIVHMQGQAFSIKDTSYTAKAVRDLIRAYAKISDDSSPSELGEEHKYGRLWLELGRSHRQLLKTISLHPDGIFQGDLIGALGLGSAEELRGARNGTSRIAARLGVDHGIRVAGYSANTRRFYIDKAIARLIHQLDTVASVEASGRTSSESTK